MALSDYERVSENLLKFYFRNTDGEYLSECKHSLSAVNNLIKSSDYSGELKSTLYYFFIEPEEIILSLARELTEKAAALSQKYDESLDLFNKLKDEFDFETLYKGLNNLKNHKMDTAGFEEIYISFCLLNKNCIKSYYYDNAALLLMIKAGMLKTRNRGRTVLYSINKGYFRSLCELLGKYYKEQ